MECKQCGKEFKAKRSTALYCSGVCRALSAREHGPRALTMHERQCATNNETRSRTDQHTINTVSHKSYDELAPGESNCVPLPGDEDYEGCVQLAECAT